jgi:hypothetical protein
MSTMSWPRAVRRSKTILVAIAVAGATLVEYFLPPASSYGVPANTPQWVGGL